MSLQVFAAPKEHWGWLCTRVGYSPTDFFQAIEATDKEGRIRGMVGFDFWTKNSAQMLVALDVPIACRALVKPAFEYLFQQQGRRVALAIVSAENVEALKLDKHLGFREVHRVKDGHSDGIDLVVLEMRREECRFLKEKGRD